MPFFHGAILLLYVRKNYEKDVLHIYSTVHYTQSSALS